MAVYYCQLLQMKAHFSDLIPSTIYILEAEKPHLLAVYANLEVWLAHIYIYAAE